VVNRWEDYLKISGWTSEYPSMNLLLKHLKYRKIGSESSRCIYGNVVYTFCMYSGKSPDEVVSLGKVEVEKLIEDFCYHKMENEWKSPRTANTALFMLKTFFKVNGFKGNQKLDVECFHQSVRERTRPEYIPTLDEARRMANVAGSLRNRAIIFFMVSTGLRNSTLRALLFTDVKEELEKGAVNILIKVHKGMKEIVSSACKGNTEYSVFASEEATEALKLYLYYRRRYGEIHDEEILFCSEHNRLSRRERTNKPLTARELQIIVKTAARKAGIKEWKNVVPHGLRKTFESVLRSQFADGGRLDLKTQEYFMGHILGGSMDTYFDKTKIDELRKEYAKLIFRPEKLVSIEILGSLRGMAKVLGIDIARLEELKSDELSRSLNDEEKLLITQNAIKRVVTEFKKAVEANAKTTLLAAQYEAPPEVQQPTEKSQIANSVKGVTCYDSTSSRNLLTLLNSSTINPSKEQGYCPQEKLLISPIQLNLDMRPQQSNAQSRPRGRISRAISTVSSYQKNKKDASGLLQFLLPEKSEVR
jgi:integrase